MPATDQNSAATEEIVNVRRRQSRAVKTRRRILEGALEEFAAMGFEGATTRSIADRAGVPHGLLIYHYDTKLGIWQAVMERAFAEVHDSIAKTFEELEGSDPAVILKALNRNFIQVSASRPELNWIFSHEVAGSSERLVWLLDQIRGRDIDVTLGLVRELQAQGRYVEGDPAHLHFLFIGAASRVFALAPEIEHRVGVTPFSKTFVERHIELCEKLFFREPPPGSDAGSSSDGGGRTGPR